MAIAHNSKRWTWITVGLISLLICACGTRPTPSASEGTERALVASITALAGSNNGVEQTLEPQDAQGTIQSLTIENNYPDSLTFNLLARPDVPLRRVTLYYWFQGQDSRILESVPFSRGDEIKASYTWDTSRITVAPSTPIYFTWELEDEAGNITLTGEQLVYYDDLRFAWNEIKDDEIVLRWYEGDEQFGDFVFETARQSLDWMKETTGAGLDFPIFILLYANPGDFASWHFQVEDWVGGQAFTSLGVTTQILGPDHPRDWIEGVIPHEIAHLFFYQQTNTNLASWPSWLDEGFAQFFEFSIDKPAVLDRVSDAAQRGQVTPLRYLSGSFGHDPQDVRLAYDQSLTVVLFIFFNWGDVGLESLIQEIRRGATINDALLGAFGLTFEQFEAQWLTWLGAPATPRPSPTMVPTFGVFGMPTAQTTGTPEPGG